MHRYVSACIPLRILDLRNVSRYNRKIIASKHYESGASVSENADHVPLPVIAGEMNRDKIPFPTS